MRLARGSGVRGLAGNASAVDRARSRTSASSARCLAGGDAELEQLCAAAGLAPARRPQQRGRAVRAGAGPPRACRARLARSRGASPVPPPTSREADAALDWAAQERMEACRARAARQRSPIRPGERPAEIVRRIVARAIRKLATEGEFEPRGSGNFAADFDPRRWRKGHASGRSLPGRDRVAFCSVAEPDSTCG